MPRRAAATLTRQQRRDLRRIFGARLLEDESMRIARSVDASCYRIVPKAIVRPQHAGQVMQLMRWSTSSGVPMTFRAAGTSLSGQAIGPGLLVEVGWGTFREFHLRDQGREVASGPGVIGGRINAELLRHQRRLGPDPASINHAMLGGMLANNASGMCCGTRDNAYQTLKNMVFILGDGLRVDTCDPRSDEHLAAARPDLHDGLLALRQELQARPDLVATIQRKFAIKNTSGYMLPALIDFDRVADIMAHLMIGSEGTLGFIERVVMTTVPDPPLKMTGLVEVGHLNEAAEVAIQYGELGAAAVELMDASSLQAARRIGTLSDEYGAIDEGGAALLVEFQHFEDEALEERRQLFLEATEGHRLVVAPTLDGATRARLWAMRKSLYPAVGGRRPVGNTIIIEDLCVQPPAMGDLIVALKPELARYGFDDHVVFGHAKDGNLHFIAHADLNHQAGIDRYDRFMDRVVEIVVGQFDGSLKAEHGTGRNIAPFLKREWGSELYEVMVRIKRLFDPGNQLNPGVLINADEQVHLKDLKTVAATHPEVDACMDCGFCESVCPSRRLTLTPRQRIALVRAGHQDRYAVESTCAADGLCATACPIGIDTGRMVKDLRSRRQGRLSRMLAGWVVSHMAMAQRVVRFGLRLHHRMRAFPLGQRMLRLMSTLTPYQIPVPLALPDAANTRIELKPAGGRPIVYFPTCVNRTMGLMAGERAQVSLPQAVCDVVAFLGYDVLLDPQLNHNCCGTPFFSKGMNLAGEQALAALRAQLRQTTNGGKIPVLLDVAPCLQTLRERLASEFEVIDLIDLLYEQRTKLPRWRESTVLVHPTCSMQKLGSHQRLVDVLTSMGAQVYLTREKGCCGFAGDRGLLVPELTKSATEDVAVEVSEVFAKHDSIDCVSACKTCEMALTQATERVYSSYVHSIWRHVKKVSGCC